MVFIGSSILAAILGSLSINVSKRQVFLFLKSYGNSVKCLNIKAFLAEPGYNSQSRTIAMRYNGTGPTLTFKFCDEAPWNFNKVHLKNQLQNVLNHFHLSELVHYKFTCLQTF